MSGLDASYGDRRVANRLRFTLRALIAGCSFVAIGFALLSHSLTRLHRHQATITCIQQMGGRVEYDAPFYVCLSLHQGFTAHEVIWLIIGSDPLSHAKTVVVDDPAPFGPVDLAVINRLPRLSNLALAGPYVNDSHLPVVRAIGHLQRLVLINTQVTAGGLSCLRDAHDLTSLCLAGPSIDDASVSELQHLRQLRHLRLIHTRVTSAGIARLRKTQTLESLQVLNTPARSDDALLYCR